MVRNHRNQVHPAGPQQQLSPPLRRGSEQPEPEPERVQQAAAAEGQGRTELEPEPELGTDTGAYSGEAAGLVLVPDEWPEAGGEGEQLTAAASGGPAAVARQQAAGNSRFAVNGQQEKNSCCREWYLHPGCNVINNSTTPDERVRDELAREPAADEEEEEAKIKILEKYEKESETKKKKYGHNAEFAGRVPLLNPDRPYRILWDTVAFFVLIYVAVYAPVRFGFNAGKDAGKSAGWDLFVDLFFLVDIVTNFLTSYHKADGRLETNYTSIFLSYLFGWFLVDLPASMSFILSLLDIGEDLEMMRILRLFRLAKLLRFIRILEKLQSSIDLLDDAMTNHAGTLTSMLQVFKSLGFILLCAHLLAALWHRAGEGGAPFDEYSENTTTWTTEANISTSGLRTQYITSLYWAVTTLTTVGYGDITPYTTSEKVVAMLSMTIGSVMFCYLAGNVIAFVSHRRQSDILKEKKLEAVNEYLRVRGVDVETKREVRKHFTEFYEHRTAMEEAELLEIMPLYLKKKVVKQVYGHLIDNLVFLQAFSSANVETDVQRSNRSNRPLFAPTPSKRSMRRLQMNSVYGYNMDAEKHELCLALEPLPRFERDEVIYTEHDHSTEFYLISEGSVLWSRKDPTLDPIFLPRANRRGESNEKKRRELSGGEDFGLNEMLGLLPRVAGQGREYTVTAGPQGCKLMILTQHKFAALCQQFPHLRAVVSIWVTKEEEIIAKHDKHLVKRGSSRNSLQRHSSRDVFVTTREVREFLEKSNQLPWPVHNKDNREAAMAESIKNLEQMMLKLLQRNPDADESADELGPEPEQW